MSTILHRIHLSLILGVLAALAGCVGVISPGSGPAASAPEFRVGDRWVYHGNDGFFRTIAVWDETHEVMAIGADGITVRITQKGPSIDVTRTELWSLPGQVKIGAVYNNETRRFVTPLQRYDFPLADGKMWSQFVDSYNEATKADGQINRYVRVRGWDKVTTAAGTFDALAMHVIMRLDDDAFWRTATECNYLVWYAPAVRGVVREQMEAQYLEKSAQEDGRSPIRTQHAVLELISFTPGRS